MTKSLVTLLLAGYLFLSALSFTVVPQKALAQRNAITTASFLFGPPKDDGSPGDYVCKDCGYVFTKGPKAWQALPDNYSCPPCGAPKRRFTKVPKGSASGKVDVKKKWF